MRAFLLLVFLSLTANPTLAQAPIQADAGIDQIITILENEDIRTLLIERLRQAQEEPDEPASPETAPDDISLTRQLAKYTRAVAESFSATLQSLGQVLVEMRDGFTGALDADYNAIGDVTIGLAAVATGLLGSFLFLRLPAGWVQDRLVRRIEGRRGFVRIIPLFINMTLNVVLILVAWAIGYGIALIFTGGATGLGQMGINQSLLLNAFLVVELIRLVSQILLSPRYTALRLLPISDKKAADCSFWLSLIVLLLGYIFLFVTPMLATSLPAASIKTIQAIAITAAVVIGCVIVLQNREAMRQWLANIAAWRGHDGTGKILAFVGQHWHVVAVVYLLTLLVLWFLNPGQTLPFMLGATIKSSIAVAAAVAILTCIAYFGATGLSLPDDIRQRLPLLEERLRTFVPRAIYITEWIVIVGTLLAIGQAWTLLDFIGWIRMETGQQVVWAVISVTFIILACIILHMVVASWVDYRLNSSIGKVPSAREKTLLGLIRNAFTVALSIFGLMLALAQIGVNIAPLLAGAGVVGLAIGFGAQKLVQDVITGIFIQFENVMNEGDSVEVAGKSGVVEKLTIRSVTIRDMRGTVHLIPFSAVDQVSNMVRGFSFYIAEFAVAYDSDAEAVKQVMREAFNVVLDVPEHREVIIDALDPPVLASLTEGKMTFRSRIKTMAGRQWGPGRLYAETVKRMLAERGIDRPIQTIAYRTVESQARPLSLGSQPSTET